jgi:hypothetical protein
LLNPSGGRRNSDPPRAGFLLGYGRRAVLRTKSSQLSPREVILGLTTPEKCTGVLSFSIRGAEGDVFFCYSPLKLKKKAIEK